MEVLIESNFIGIKFKKKIKVKSKIMIIVSLTTIPPRFNFLYLTVNSIINQTVKPDKIIIHIPEKYNNFFYEKLPVLPQECEDSVNIIINQKTKDYGPITKLLGLYDSLEFCNISDDDVIIVIDDDRIYNKNLISNFLQYHELDKSKVLTAAGLDIEILSKNSIKTKNKKKQPRGNFLDNNGYTDTLMACCGFLITKKLCPFNHKELFEVKSSDDRYYVDDILISGFLTLNNTDIYLISDKNCSDEERGPNDTICALYDNTRTEKNISCIKYFINNFDIWK